MKKQNKFLTGIVLLLMISFYSCTNNEEMFDEENAVELSNNEMTKRVNQSGKTYIYQEYRIYIKYNTSSTITNPIEEGNSTNFNDSFSQINNIFNRNNYIPIPLDDFGIANNYDRVWSSNKTIGYIDNNTFGSVIQYFPQELPNDEDKIIMDLESGIYTTVVEGYMLTPYPIE